jgi:hypothetical protein
LLDRAEQLGHRDRPVPVRIGLEHADELDRRRELPAQRAQVRRQCGGAEK